MKIRKGVVFAAGLVLGAAVAMADDHAGHDHAGHDHAAHAEGAAHDMEAWEKAAMPGDHHENMKWFVGDWNTHSKHWMGEGEPTEETGKATFELAMDGRYLMGTYTGMMMGKPFEGHSLDAFDNMTGEHVNIWIDNHGTGILMTKGSCSDEGNVVETAGMMASPHGGMPIRMVTTKTGEDSFTFEMFMKMGPDAEEARVMLATYNRMSS